METRRVNLALVRRGGVVQLVHWDYHHGDDRIWLLGKHGKVTELTDKEEHKSVALVAALRKLVGAEVPG